MVKRYGKKKYYQNQKRDQRKLLFQKVKAKVDLRILATFKIVIVSVYIFV